MSGFSWKQSGDLKYLELTAFTEQGGVKAFFSSRIGGVSKKPFAYLNMGFHTGDKKEAVQTNRNRFSETVGMELSDWVAAEQVHCDTIQTISTSEKGLGAEDLKTAIPATDALVTNTPGVVLSTYYADCVPLYFWDPENRVIALAHAGWKGTVLKIGFKTLNYLAKKFNTRPENCFTAIGPSIGSCCYQVDAKVAVRIKQEFDFAAEVLQPDGTDRWKLDLQKVNYLTLINAGVLPSHISDSALCTCCNADSFYSYRREGRTGRMAALLQLC